LPADDKTLFFTRKELLVRSDWPSGFPGINWLDQQEEEAVVDVLRKGALFRYYGLQPPAYVNQLEQYARDFYGVRHVLAVNSGTGALCTAMSALGIGPGDEVIVPAFLWVATVTAVIQNNAIPVLCEIDDSFNMDPEDLERKITERTKLIAVVHMAGTPCDMDGIMRVADRHNIPLLEDCAQCNGGSFRGKRVGTFGKVGIFSLQINKNCTAGEGGFLVTDDEQLYSRLVAAHDLGIPWKQGLPDETGDVYLWGQGRRMGELAGAVANVQLRKLPQVVAHMKDSKQRIRSALGHLEGVSFRRLNDPEGDTGPFLILTFEKRSRAVGAAQCLMDSGIENVFHLSEYGLHIYHNIRSLVEMVPLSPAGNPWSLPQNAGHPLAYAKGTCSTSDDLFERSVIITIPSRLTEQQETDMVRAIRNAIGGSNAG
jgi:8-amino-3,8-dideoxy-alpha-D-manno-octulosonate transaminase